MDDQAPESSTLAAGAAGAGAMLVGVTAWLIVRQLRLTRLAQELADAEAAARPMSNLEPEDGSGRSGGSAASPARARAPLRLDIEADGGASLLRAAAADEVPAAPLSSKRLRPPPASTTPRMSASGEPSPETERHQPMEFATGEHESEGPPPVIVVARDPNAAASLEPQKTGDKGSHPAPGHRKKGSHGDGEKRAAHQKPKPKRTRSEEERAAIAAAKVAAAVEARSGKRMLQPQASAASPPRQPQPQPPPPPLQPQQQPPQQPPPPPPSHQASAVEPPKEEMPAALRQKIDAMKREMRRSHEEGLGKSATRREARRSHDATATRETRSSFKAAAAAPPASPGSPLRRGVAACSASPAVCATRSDLQIGSPRAGPPTPRKQVITPPSAMEESEMAMFVQVESERRRQQHEATGYSPAAKLRELRRDLGEGGISDSCGGCCDGEPSCDRPHGSKHGRRKAGRKGGSSKSSSSQAGDTCAAAAQGHDGAGGTTAGSGGGNSPFGQRAAAVARSLSKSFGSSPPFGGGGKEKQQQQRSNQPPTNKGVQGLQERQRREAREQKAREGKKAQAERLLAMWHEKHRGDVYAMMSTIKLFTDLFGTDPLAGQALARGDAHALKKVWHKLAAKLHPDRQRSADISTQVLAEEVFKALTIAYTKEMQRIETANSGKSFNRV